MKLRLILKIATISSVALLCMGFAISLYFKISIVERAEDFDLYTLVPGHSQAILDTDNMVELMEALNNLNCSKDRRFLYVSRLFSYLKDHINTLLEETPHGLSKQMNKMLISFHAPDNDRNQVFYCRLGTDDYAFVERFIEKYCATSFPSKFFDYKGEEIHIYPMPDDDFLACYFTSEFLAISYQKRLIEDVIDAYHSRKSILSDATFAKIRSERRTIAPATIYARMEPIDMGENTNEIHSQAALGHWTEFNMNMSADAVFFTGMNYDPDSSVTFMNALRKQSPVDGFPGETMPASTFLFNRQAISDLQSLFDFTSRNEYDAVDYPDDVLECDKKLLDYLCDHASASITSCMFHRADTLSAPHVVANISLWDAIESERFLKNMVRTLSRESEYYSSLSNGHYVAPSGSYAFYMIPRNSLFIQLTGVTSVSSHTYACFYKGQMLLAPDGESIPAYIRAIEKGDVLEDDSVYMESVDGLSQSYNFMMMADLGTVFEKPENCGRLIPNFFFRNQEFFCHFVLSTQFTCIENVIYPSVVLLYKKETI